MKVINKLMALNLIKRFKHLELLKSSTHSENTNFFFHPDHFPATRAGVLEVDVKAIHNPTVTLSHKCTLISYTATTKKTRTEDHNNTSPYF